MPQSKSSTFDVDHDSRRLLRELFSFHRDTIIRELNGLFFSCTFQNSFPLNPGRLSVYGEEEFHHFEAYLTRWNPEAVSAHGKVRAEEGLYIQAVLSMFFCYVRFFTTHAAQDDRTSVQDGLGAVFAYAAAYIEGYSSAQRQKILQQQKEIRQALSTALTKQREMLFVRDHSIKSSINGILITDLNNRVIFVNPSFLDLWKYNDEGAVLKNGDLEEIAGEAVEKIFRSLADRGSFRGELQLENSEGEKFDVGMSASRIVDDRGTVFGTMASFVDISDRKRIEAQFRRSQKMNALGQLASGITHDFNNMFAVVKSYLQLVMMDAEKDSQLFEDLQQIKIAVERSSALTKQLQYFARGVSRERHPVDLNEIIKENRDLLIHILPPEIEVILLLENELWTLMGDASQLSHVLVNFCVNARDAVMEKQAAQSGEVTAAKGRVEIRTRNISVDSPGTGLPVSIEPGRYVLLTVEDNGAGMSSETQERLFEPFYSTKKSSKNSGLGLSIIYGIVENQKGYIDVHSELGRGSTFDVYLPALSIEVADSASDPDGFIASQEQDTVLIVDDEPQLLDVVSRFLTRHGYKVITAENGLEGVEAYKRARDAVGLVILDIMMPEMNGEACFREIRKIDPQAKVILLTGFTNEKTFYESMRNDIVGIVEKPFDLFKLTDAIKRALQLRK